MILGNSTREVCVAARNAITIITIKLFLLAPKIMYANSKGAMYDVQCTCTYSSGLTSACTLFIMTVLCSPYLTQCQYTHLMTIMPLHLS